MGRAEERVSDAGFASLRRHSGQDGAGPSSGARVRPEPADPVGPERGGSLVLGRPPAFATLPSVLPPLRYSALGFETFRDDVLLPSAVLARHPLEVGVWQPDGHPPVTSARTARYRPAELGLRWGPVWSTAFFRLRGRVPAAMRGWPVWLRFSSGTEATLWDGRRPVQGFDPYRDRALLVGKAKGGEPVDLLVEAACNLPLGISTFWWDHPELHARWKEPKPGRLEAAELVAVDDGLWRFARAWDQAVKVLLELAPESPRAVALNDGLRSLKESIDAADPGPGMRAGMGELSALLRGKPGGSTMTCVAVGHAHIDTAWLWPLRETRRKCIRTFANVLRLMERHPRFRFLCSQAQQYAYVEEDAPALFAEIRRRVAEGRWEPGGAMWIEPDATCPSGESFVRQILHGVRYWRERFGDAAPQRFLYLPDTFGFPPCLPQIARLAGLDTFITNKMSWCESNRFPHVNFRWRGLDGTEILTHLTPGHNYNAPLEPHDLVHAERMLATQDGASFVNAAIPRWLQPFGYGDGGGGPTEEQVLRLEQAAVCEGVASLESSRVDRFCGSLHAARAGLGRRRRDLAVWDGELYLELHRGTYTSQAWIKRQNRLAESLLREVEWLSATMEPAAGRRTTARRLDPLWKLVLLNQFHDILPGSSIGEVYADAKADHLRVATDAGQERDRLLQQLTRSTPARGLRQPILVRNPASTVRGGVVEVEGAVVSVDAVPACGFRVIDAAAHALDGPGVRCERSPQGITLANAWLEATIDGAGRIADLRVHGMDRAANGCDARGRLLPMNQLVLYEDRPRRWEAWDIDRDYATKARPVEGKATVEAVSSGPLRCEVRVRRPLGARSELFQTYRLDANSRRLDIVTHVDWQEERTMLRALFPCGVRATQATFGTQFGHLVRPTHRNTSWDEARFEVPGHAWMELSEPGFGVALLDDGKYGRSAVDAELGLTLLRAPGFPDATADRGEHVFTYSVMLHDGDWRAAGVDAEAEALREPLRAIALPAGRQPKRPAAEVRESNLGTASAPFTVVPPSSAHLAVAAWKAAESGAGRILRLVEVRGGRGEAEILWGEGGPTTVRAVDLLERPFGRGDGQAPSVRHDRRRMRTRVSVRPFQIVTLLAEGT